MNKRLLLLLLFFPQSLIAGDFEGIRALAKRRVPWLSSSLVFKKLEMAGKKDCFVLRSQAGKVIIEANGPNAAAVGLNWYLKYYCHRSMSHTGDNLSPVSPLPMVKAPVKITTNAVYRYALNYCTYNYTMSFWGWEEWEHELDWMALQGVNLMLAPMGTEEVWQQVLTALHFTPADIQRYIPGPAFNAWWLMGNVQGWGGPASNAMIHHWTTLQQKMLGQMKELGIQPVLQGFCGMVPSSIRQYFPHAQIVDQGNWGDGFKRPVFLLPQDTLFNKIAALYYKHLRQLYGEAYFLGGDLFHEGGTTGNIDLGKTAALIQANMQQYYPRSTWILQAWQDNPKKDFLAGLDSSHTLILDLRGDADNNWERTNGFSGYPWIWCSMVNGGGTLGMEGRLTRVLTEPARAATTMAGRSMVGIGIVPEGIANNDIMYTSLLQSAWQADTFSIDAFLRHYIVARYGKYDPDIYDAWQLLLQSAYISHTNELTGAYESIFCARPDTNFITSVSTWGSKKLAYDSVVFYKAAGCFAKAASRFTGSNTYRYDLVDIWRQVIALKARQSYAGFMNAYYNKDFRGFETNKEQFIALLKLQDRWTATHPDFSMDTWVQQARDLLPDATDKAMAEWNAKVQVTYWGPATNPATLVHDYAHKEWSGLLNAYYLPRWLHFFEYATARFKGTRAAWPDFFSFEKKWTEQPYTVSDKAREDCIAILPVVINTFF
ncbi:alpha-N-acetylglucosaminidase [Pseudoflavitalea sp. X16]|uniref:alpha-N-acetylglucosaminidase n=1 Tax=Paraflavitalea devenefica TaxID=2716334 RepID=UPI0014226B20|nr:alpha-N-acetylglucosaminidase [Paraflavitalea devenefica]NII25951.1 alpha-N-acetylglucosaminidase [Paraflavitalea devenefica]